MKYSKMAWVIGILFTLGTLPAVASDGKGVYDTACQFCHTSGMAGAPKLGDTAAWKSRLKKGEATLVANAIKGFKGDTGFMPGRGGNPSLSDDDVTAAVDYMLSTLK